MKYFGISILARVFYYQKVYLNLQLRQKLHFFTLPELCETKILICPMKKFFSEFKDFAMKGNVVDMTVGVIIGAAFGKIVTSLVNDIIMPAIGMLTGGVNFSDHKWVIQKAVEQAGEVITPEVAITWGAFIQTIIDFIIIAFCIFIAIKFVNKLKREKPAEEPAPAGPSQEELLTEIRDLLRQEVAKK